MTEPGHDVANSPDPPGISGPPLRGEILLDPPNTGGNQAGLPTVALLDALSLVMERLFVVPGTNVRYGVNSFFMVVPVVGDLVPTMVSFTIVYLGAVNCRVPRIVAARMLLNTILDASVGWIPVVGPLFDVWFKADTRNVRLLREYAGRSQTTGSTAEHWLFVAGLLAAVTVFLGLLGMGMIALVRAAFGGA